MKHNKVKSANVAAFDDVQFGEVTRAIVSLGLNTLTVPVRIDIPSMNSSSMTINETSQVLAKQIIEDAKRRNLQIILEPYPMIQSGEIGETQYNPTDVNAFFWNWKTEILAKLISEIANPYSVEAIYIGSNFEQLESYHDYWRGVVDDTRKIYKGELTYRTNFWITAAWAPETITAYEAKLNNPMWGYMDFISIAAYFELNEANNPSKAQLVADLRNVSKYGRGQNIVEEIKAFYTKWNKPVFFGELGFVDLEKTASEPWSTSPSTVVSEIAQNTAFAAYQEVFENEHWFMGFSLFAIGMQSSKYNVMDKLAEITIRNWWKMSPIIISPSAEEIGSEILQYKLRPNSIRTNAPYRGPTDMIQYTNFLFESLHDINLLGKILDRDEDQKIKGQSDFIRENFAAYFSGEDSEIRSNTQTATKMFEQKQTIRDGVLDNENWMSYGGCTVAKSSEGYILTSDGSQEKSGILSRLEVQEGQVLSIRMKAKVVNGEANHFRIGSLTVNSNEGATKTFSLSKEEKWVGLYFECREKESISINIEVIGDAEIVKAGQVEIKDFSISLLDTNDYYLEPTNTRMKSKVNQMNEEIQNILSNL